MIRLDLGYKYDSANMAAIYTLYARIPQMSLVE